LRARDARALIRFLVDVVGFEETVVWRRRGRPSCAGRPLGGGIMLGSARAEDDADRWPLRLNLRRLRRCRTIRRALRTGAAGGAEITDRLHTTDYGSRDFAIRDPEGNRWSFAHYRGEPRQPPP
jgi:uncharacterized glyoxalase superfamily protein PhnB